MFITIYKSERFYYMNLCFRYTSGETMFTECSTDTIREIKYINRMLKQFDLGFLIKTYN